MRPLHEDSSMSHSKLFPPSASSRWLNCPGSVAFSENQGDGKSSTFADDGSATHWWAAEALQGRPADVGAQLVLNSKEYTLDEERAERIQGYVEDVSRRAIGGYLFVEKRIDLSSVMDRGEGGTSDAVICLPSKRLGIIEDLKDGSGEKVYASYIIQPATETTPEIREPNPQLALYALGMLPEFELFGEIDEVLLVIYQPKLGHIDEFPISIAALQEFGRKASTAVELAKAAMVAGPASLTTSGYLYPGTRQCRWCRAKSTCPALARFVADEVRADFDTIEAETPKMPTDTKQLAKAYNAVPLIEMWCKSVKTEAHNAVLGGKEVIGTDGKPLKFVEGKQGDRAWIDPLAAEAALVGRLGPRAYSEPKLLTAPAAGKLLDKKATKAIWTDLFEALIKRSPGKPTLVLGTDPRPPVSGAASAEEFSDEL
jgi:Protein of unknown function (DUF2800)